MHLILVFFICLLLPGCNSQSSDRKDPDNPFNSHDRYISMLSYCESDQGIYYIEWESELCRLYFIDKKSSKKTVLCQKVNCRHDSAECPAVEVSPDLMGSVAYCDGFIYYIVQAFDSGEQNDVLKLYSMKEDGTEKKELHTFQYGRVYQVIAAALQSQVDGINLDFELISSKCGVHYIQFVRELSVKCRENNLVLSVDNYVPKPYNTQYDLKEQAAVADYVFIMAYDEHTDGSNEAGSVASISYLENGVTDALKLVPKEKLVAAIPFFTRLWKETPKTEEELAAEAGTEAADYPNSVSSQALGMDEAAQAVQNAGVTAQWDDETKQNYAKWEADGSTYRIWLEDMQSLEEKMTVIRQNELAGVAEWSLGRENSGVWDLILQYLN